MEFVDYFLIFICLNLAILFVYQNIESLCPESGLFADICRPIVQSKAAAEQKERMQNVGNLAPSLTQNAATTGSGRGECSTLEFPGTVDPGIQSQGRGAAFHSNLRPPEVGLNYRVNGINQCRLAGNMGPKVGFHQAFKPHVPEMGWRNFFMRFYGTIDKVDQLKADKLRTASGNGFNNTVIRNFLDNMPSTDNIYRYTTY